MKYVISGMAPGPGGVPRLMEYLLDVLEDSKYQFIYPKNHNNKNIILRRLLNGISKYIFFNIKLLFIKNKEIILLHHQSIGLKQVTKLISRNSVNFYVMDNSFFCIKSYNYINGQGKECLDCIGGSFDAALENDCQTFPIKFSIEENIVFLKYLKEKSQKIKFYTLSDSNASLLKKHFGKNTFVEPIYFLTNDLLKDQEESRRLDNHDSGYDIVFHAADIEAKGFIYIQELANKLPQYKIFIPTSKKIINENTNIDLKFITWETGLKEIVINCKLVLTPSVWSNTPEAATLKSFLYNGSVGIIKNKYGFANDIEDDAFLQLSGDSIVDANNIDYFLKEKKYKILRKKGKKYISSYIADTKKSMQKLFLCDRIV